MKIIQDLLKVLPPQRPVLEPNDSEYRRRVDAAAAERAVVDDRLLLVDADRVSVEAAHPLNALLSILKSIFRPASPTDDPALFKGREQELSRVLGTVQELGQHAVIYGERGVGKTSLAYMARDGFTEGNPQALAVRIPCSADDDFTTTWKKFIPRLTKELDLWEHGDRQRVVEAADKAEDILDFNDVSPDTVVRALNVISNRVPLLVILDEFDRLGDPSTTEPFADIIKMASDDLMPATLLIVGVADDVASLIAGHRSIERSMRQIYMPRMSRHELSRIVVDGFETFSRRSGYPLSVDSDVVDAIVHLSQGFPYYTHLLAGAVGELAIRRSAHSVDRGTVFDALFTAVEEATQSIRVSYTDAVTSPKQNAQFADTLLACALSRVDELGFFAPADVATPLSSLLSVPRSTPDFLHHLKRFAGPPSWILETRGDGRRARYRFHNPLMKPFVLMKGVRDRRLTLEQASTDQP